MPEKPKVYVKKQGQVCKVFLDPSTMKPQPIGDFYDEPAGTIPHTYVTVKECESALRGFDIVYVEKPKKAKKATVGAVDQAKIDKILNNSTPEKEADLSGLPRSGAATAALAQAPAPKLKAVPPGLDLASIYLDKLECARKYASKENQKILDLKIETAKEMIDEVFGVGRD